MAWWRYIWCIQMGLGFMVTFHIFLRSAPRRDLHVHNVCPSVTWLIYYIIKSFAEWKLWLKMTSYLFFKLLVWILNQEWLPTSNPDLLVSNVLYTTISLAPIFITSLALLQVVLCSGILSLIAYICILISTWPHVYFW